jgi:hypothetical protein
MEAAFESSEKGTVVYLKSEERQSRLKDNNERPAGWKPAGRFICSESGFVMAALDSAPLSPQSVRGSSGSPKIIGKSM